jgi:release factor glutamine methyltransferase
MNYREARQYYAKRLQGLYDGREAETVTDWVLEHVTGLDKLQRHLDRTAILTPRQQAAMEQAFQQLEQHKPVQYVLGEAWFYGLRFRVNENVLIPRPETEELVQWVLEDMKLESSPAAPAILDIGTGSGCIAVALQKKLPAAHVSALDISREALNVAGGNATLNYVTVNLIRADILDKNTRATLLSCDIIVSNPPYVCERETAGMQAHVLDHEPRQALFVPDDNALVFYRAIAAVARQKLNPHGRLYLEINEALGLEVTALLEATGFREVQLRQDLFGKDRMVKAVSSS